MRYLPESQLPAQAWFPGRGARPLETPARPALSPARWREDDGYLWGCELYNHGFVWEAHEVWEGAWRTSSDAPRELFQGLIQSAAACVKVACNDLASAARLMNRARTRLHGVRTLMGLDAVTFADATTAWLARRPTDLSEHPRLVLPVVRVLSTPRLNVRQLAWDDLDAMANLCAQPRVMRYVGDNRPLTRAAVEASIAQSLEDYRVKPHAFGRWAVCAREDGDFVGYAGIVEPEGEPELVYTLEPRFWGRGLGREVARAVLGYALARVPRVIATVDPANGASRRILASLGFAHARTGVDAHALPTEWWSVTASTARS